MNNVKSKYALLLRKDGSNHVQDLRLKIDLLDWDRNLTRNEYMELHKDRVKQIMEHNHTMAILKADQLGLMKICYAFQSQQPHKTESISPVPSSIQQMP